MSEHQKQTVEELVIDLIRIRAAAKDIESILDAALSNASGNPEFDSVSRRVRGFREAVLCLPESVHPDTELIDGIEVKLNQRHHLEVWSMQNFHVDSVRRDNVISSGEGDTLRDAIRDFLK